MMFARCHAQVPSVITSDGTMSTVITDQGAVFHITGGTRPGQGPNLFHSFGQFDVGMGDTAHFVAQEGINNIIGRVTGPEASRIDGTLQADASLFLLNPQGLLFGPSATLNIHGSFHATTADVLRFADGAAFSTRLSEKSTLTVASPSAFGFLHTNPASIAIERSHLEVPEGQTLSLVGGDMTIAGDGDPSLGPPNLAAPGGRINLASVASSGHVAFDAASPLSGLDVGSSDQVKLGQMDIVAGARIDVSGEGGGAVVIRGGRLRMDHAWLFADTLGHLDGDEVGVDIAVDEWVLTHEGRVTTHVGEFGTGNAGNVSIVARHLRVDGGAQIGSSTFGPGKGGTVTVQATEVSLEGRTPDNQFPSGIIANAQGTAEGAGNAGAIVIKAQKVSLSGGAAIGSSTFGPGHGGAVTVQATEVNLEGATPDNRFSTGLFATAQGVAEGAGNAGAIVIEAQQVSLSGGAAINSSTFGPGHGGAVTVRAAELILGAGHIFASAAGQREGAGDAGDIVIETQQVRLSGGAQIASGTFGSGKGGTVTVRATELTLGASNIFSNAHGEGEGAGDAGGIVVEAQQVHLSGGAQIVSATFGPGKGGTVTVQATEVNLEGATPDNSFLSGVFVNAQGGTGDAGDIVVEAQQVHLSGGAQITSGTFGSGKGGTVTVRATTMTLEGATPDNSFLSGLFANAQGKAEGAGDAGAIVVEAQQVHLSGGAQIASVTFGPGKGGMVTVRATEVNLEGATPDNSFLSGLFVTSEGRNEHPGDAGTILIEADQLTLSGGAQINSFTLGSGKGGTVTVQATKVSLEGATPDNRFPSGIVATAQGEGAGDAGTILVDAGYLTLSGGARINSTTFGPGSGGAVTVRAKEIALDGATSDHFFPSGILAGALGEGDAGTILVDAGHLTLSGGARISSTTFGPGNGGAVTVHATTMTLEGATPDNSFLSGLFANAQGEGEDSGDAGAIVVEAQQVRLSGGAQIASATLGPGNGGNITLHGSQLLLTEGASLSSRSSGEGNAGTIQVEVTDLTLRDHSLITTEASRAGGGDIDIEAQILSMLDSAITATVETGAASGGNIRIGGMINADGEVIESLDRLSLEGSRITANTDAGDGANIVMGARQVVLDSGSAIAANTNAGVGGNVAIAGTVAADGHTLSQAGTILLRESRITASAQAGQGGRIDIVAEVFLADPDSVIDASSQLGIDGEVNIEAVVSNLSEVVEPLSPRLASETALLRDLCATRLQQGLVSSFVERGRAGIPSAPDGLLPSRLDMSDAETAGSGESLPHGMAMAGEPSWRLSSRCP
jgi:filamentous hemagglutinin family protein